MSNTKYISLIKYWTPARYMYMLAVAQQKRCNDPNSNRSLIESPWTVFLLAGERNRRQSHNALATEKRQSSGAYVQYPRSDLSHTEVHSRRCAENESRDKL